MFRYIKAMAYDKQSVQNSLESVASSLTDHLIKLYLFSESEYVSHWRQEVWHILNRVSKLKHSKKFPDSRFIFNCISGYADMCDNLIGLWCSEYDSLTPTRVDYEEAEKLILEYFKWLSDKLSSQGSVTSAEVYNELDRVGF